jgi:hypothetical protein
MSAVLPFAVTGKRATCGKQAFPVPVDDQYLIPPLGSEEYKLVQVQAFFRHGDRTPWRADQCWTPDGGIGVCDYTDYLESAFGEPLLAPGRRFAFKRIYDDANKCEVGQLTTYGFHQELNNGQLLRKAYIEGIVLNLC